MGATIITLTVESTKEQVIRKAIENKSYEQASEHRADGREVDGYTGDWLTIGVVRYELGRPYKSWHDAVETVSKCTHTRTAVAVLFVGADKKVRALVIGMAKE